MMEAPIEIQLLYRIIYIHPLGLNVVKMVGTRTSNNDLFNFMLVTAVYSDSIPYRWGGNLCGEHLGLVKLAPPTRERHIQMLLY